jgi:hypothetical protein
MNYHQLGDLRAICVRGATYQVDNSGAGEEVRAEYETRRQSLAIDDILPFFNLLPDLGQLARRCRNHVDVLHVGLIRGQPLACSPSFGPLSFGEGQFVALEPIDIHQEREACIQAGAIVECDPLMAQGLVVLVVAIPRDIFPPSYNFPFCIPLILFFLVLIKSRVPFLGMLALDLEIEIRRQLHHRPCAKKVRVGSETKDDGFNERLELLDDHPTGLLFDITRPHKLVPPDT